MKSQSFPAALALVAGLCAMSLSGSAQVTASAPGKNYSGVMNGNGGAAQDVKPVVRPVPQRVLYLFLFQNLVVLEQAAARDDAKGKDGSSWRERISREAGLTDDEGAALNEVALDWRKQQDAIQAQIKAITDARKAEPNPPKNLLTGDEFNQFGREQDELLDEHIDELKSDLGDASFAKLDAYVKARYHPTEFLPNRDGHMRPVTPLSSGGVQ